MNTQAAQMEAQARCRQDGGALYTAKWGTYEFSGSPYDALQVAREMVANGRTGVTLEKADGTVLTDDEIMAASF